MYTLKPQKQYIVIISYSSHLKDGSVNIPFFFWPYNDAPLGGSEGCEAGCCLSMKVWLASPDWKPFVMTGFSSPRKYSWLALPDWNPFVMTGFSFPWKYGWLHQTKIHLWWLFFPSRVFQAGFTVCVCLTLLALSFYYILLHQYNILYNIYTIPTPVASLTSCFH